MRALAGIVVAALAVRAWDLGGPSLWNDELFSRFYPRMGLAFLWGAGWRLEPNPPVYYTLLWGWMRVFGEGAAAVRSLGVAIGVAGVPVAYAAGRVAFGARAGLWAAWCVALSPAAAWYAQETRPYVLEGFGVLVALLGVAGFLRDGGWRWVGLYGVGGLLTAYGHVTGGAFLAAAGVAVAGLVAREGRALGRWVVGNLVLGAACLPLVGLALSPAVSRAVGWIEALRWADVPTAFAEAMLGPAAGEWGVVLGIGCAVGLAGLFGPRWGAGRAGWAMGAAAAGGFGLLALASLQQPVLMGRTAAWMALPVAVLAGGVLARRGAAARTVVVAVLCGALLLQASMARAMKEDWRGFMRMLGPRLAPPALVVLAPFMPSTAVLAYAPEAGPLFVLPGAAEDAVEWTVLPRRLGVRPISWEAVAAAVRAGRTVWVLGRGDLAALNAGLLGAPAEVVRWGPGYALRW